MGYYIIKGVPIKAKNELAAIKMLDRKVRLDLGEKIRVFDAEKKEDSIYMIGLEDNQITIFDIND